MSAVATVIYVWATLHDYAVVIISAIVIIAIAVSLWRIDVLRKRKNEKFREGVVK